MTADPNWTEILGAAILAAQLLVLLVAAGVAWYQAKEARRLREDQSRPFVVIDVDFVGTSELFLFVRNLGTSLARDVRIVIDPPLKSSIEDIEVAKFKMLSDGITTLAPGKELRTFFDQDSGATNPISHSSTPRRSPTPTIAASAASTRRWRSTWSSTSICSSPSDTISTTSTSSFRR
jgi:hypothetical protein